VEREGAVPWEITIKRPDGSSLGSQTDVQAAIERAFPGVQFYREPSGSEKLASLPAGMKVPDVIRDIWAGQGAKVQADFEAEGYSIRFYLGAEGTTSVQSVDVEARGSSRPAMPLFEALTLATDWIVTDNWKRTIVAKGETIPEAK
jgi:hypothetical protein